MRGIAWLAITTMSIVGYSSEVKAKSVCDCTAPEVCDVATGECVECTVDNDCQGSAYGNVCITDAKLCGCREDTHCSGIADYSHCDVANLTCVECTADTHCTDSSYGALCVADLCSCSTNTDCTVANFNLCDPKVNYCSQCLKNSDCSNVDTPICSSGLCVGCAQDADCASGTICLYTQCSQACSNTNPCTGAAVCVPFPNELISAKIKTLGPASYCVDPDFLPGCDTLHCDNLGATCQEQTFCLNTACAASSKFAYCCGGNTAYGLPACPATEGASNTTASTENDSTPKKKLLNCTSTSDLPSLWVLLTLGLAAYRRRH
jgi:hypothetical protein